ncbi:MAG: glycosyltransferase [Verrucomicrobia bacterium]|nr:glycosyltransferase [Verrucomicrobiota bacterium]
MRICVISGGYWPFVAGAELFCQQLAEHMAWRGHEVHVVTSIDDRAGEDRAPGLQPYAVFNGVHVHRIKSLKVRYTQTLSLIPPLTRKALELHARAPFDLIHAHIFPGLFVGARVARRTGRPLLLTLQGGDLADYPEMRIANPILRPMIRWSLPKAARVHAVSRSVAARARELGAREVVVIPNAVNLAEFQPADRALLRAMMGLAPADKIVLTVSRLTLKNAVDVLLRAFAGIRAGQPDARLLIAGTGPEEAALHALAKQLGVEDRVEFLGYVPHEQTPRYYAAADLFVRASREEGFGISFIEAMASGTAVIGSSAGGIPDIITDGVDGLTVPPDDVTALAAAAGKLLADDALRTRLAAAGLRTAHQKFSTDRVLQRMETLCHELASRLPSPP